MGLMDEFLGNEADGLLEWAEDLGVRVEFREIDRYPTSASILSEYQEEPPAIIIFRYKPWEEWLQMLCEERLRYFSPWYLIPLTLELYRHLEIHDLYRIKPPWYDMIGRWRMNSIDRRAEAFAQDILAIPYSLRRFLETVQMALRPPAPR
ncbi:MAG: hypothetical protein ABIH23_23890 [bacterium]